VVTLAAGYSSRFAVTPKCLAACVDEENLRAVTKAASIRFSERLAEAGIQPSVGAVGNAC
jgi:CTP:molybdopterin cytidylyltransferase MocA